MRQDKNRAKGLENPFMDVENVEFR
jgi:hypothetical protein